LHLGAGRELESGGEREGGRLHLGAGRENLGAVGSREEKVGSREKEIEKE